MINQPPVNSGRFTGGQPSKRYNVERTSPAEALMENDDEAS
jgi:hypothetical protein